MFFYGVDQLLQDRRTAAPPVGASARKHYFFGGRAPRPANNWKKRQKRERSTVISNLAQSMLPLVSDYYNEVPGNFAHVICQPETVLRKRSRKVCADRLGFRGLATFQEVILSVRVFRQRPLLRLETHRVSGVLCARDRNRILPSHAPQDPDESPAARNSPML